MTIQRYVQKGTTMIPDPGPEWIAQRYVREEDYIALDHNPNAAQWAEGFNFAKTEYTTRMAKLNATRMAAIKVALQHALKCLDVATDLALDDAVRYKKLKEAHATLTTTIGANL